MTHTSSRTPSPKTLWLGACLVLALSILLGACAGHQWASPADLWHMVTDANESLRTRLLWQWRMPRVLAAACVGALLGLGDATAQSFGLDVKRFVPRAVLLGSIVVAAAVAYGGLVAFVGLAAPHIARWLVGPMHRNVLLASALVGAIIVTIADALARSILPPAEVPLGLITAVAGGPFFIYLLARRLRSGGSTC